MLSNNYKRKCLALLPWPTYEPLLRDIGYQWKTLLFPWTNLVYSLWFVTPKWFWWLLNLKCFENFSKWENLCIGGIYTLLLFWKLDQIDRLDLSQDWLWFSNQREPQTFPYVDINSVLSWKPSSASNLLRLTHLLVNWYNVCMLSLRFHSDFRLHENVVQVWQTQVNCRITLYFCPN